jgi:hypothetical protein
VKKQRLRSLYNVVHISKLKKSEETAPASIYNVVHISKLKKSEETAAAIASECCAHLQFEEE